MPRVLPWTSWPTYGMGSNLVHLPAWTWRSACTILRAEASIRPKVKSAHDSWSMPGVLPTSTPQRVAAGMSMLSTPTPRLATTLRDGAASRRPACTLSSASVRRALDCAAFSSRDVGRRWAVGLPCLHVKVLTQKVDRFRDSTAGDEDLCVWDAHTTTSPGRSRRVSGRPRPGKYLASGRP